MFGNFLSLADAALNFGVWYGIWISLSQDIFTMPDIGLFCSNQGSQASHSQGILHVMLLSWLKMLWFVVDLTILIPSLRVCH